MDNRGQVQDGELRHFDAEDARRAGQLEQAQQLERVGHVGRSEDAQWAVNVGAMAERPMSQNQARGIGGQVLATQNERIGQEQAELARDEAELEHPEEFAGQQTAVQIAEGYAAERENARPELKFVRRAAERGQRAIAEETMAVVDKMMSQAEYSPAQLYDVFGREGAQMRLSYPVPERSGDVA